MTTLSCVRWGYPAQKPPPNNNYTYTYLSLFTPETYLKDTFSYILEVKNGKNNERVRGNGVCATTERLG
jgi:hypothetical protein